MKPILQLYRTKYILLYLFETSAPYLVTQITQQIYQPCVVFKKHTLKQTDESLKTKVSGKSYQANVRKQQAEMAESRSDKKNLRPQGGKEAYYDVYK